MGDEPEDWLEDQAEEEATVVAPSTPWRQNGPPSKRNASYRVQESRYLWTRYLAVKGRDR